jgi:hypothetical protein
VGQGLASDLPPLDTGALLATTPQLAVERLLNHLHALAARALRLGASQAQALEQGFAQRLLGSLGFDSLSTIELRDRMAASIGVDVPLQALAGTATPADVAQLLYRLLLLRAMSERAATTDPLEVV